MGSKFFGKFLSINRKIFKYFNFAFEGIILNEKAKMYSDS